MAEPKPRKREAPPLPRKFRLKTGEVCPECGRVINWVNRRRRALADGGTQEYIYVAHVVGSDERGRRKIEYCYVGARHYRYVERFNPLGLRHALDPERYVDYAVHAIEEVIERIELAETIENRKRWLETAQKIHARLSETLRGLEEAIKTASEA